MRRVHATLLFVVVLWALNLTITRYILQHGLQPLTYATVRYGLASAIFVAIALLAERTMRVRRHDLRLVGLAALTLFLNQIFFVYALERTAASTIALILGATPAFAALIGLALGLERLSRRFWLAILVSFAGVGLVAAGSGREASIGLGGTLLGIGAALTWTIYSMSVAPLMERYSASRISAIVLPAGWLGMAIVGAGQTAGQDFGVGTTVWLLVLVATLGPLVLTNIFWFRALHVIGASRATLIANLQPFVAALVAVVLLSEQVTIIQVAGGILIGSGILLAHRRRPQAVPAAAE